MTIFSILLFSSQQIILVVAPDINSSHAQLECMEDDTVIFAPIEVNLGTNGLGMGLGAHDLTKNQGDILKYEGDKRAPIGIFELSAIFGYEANEHYKLPYLHAEKNLICVDDSNSPFYNTIIKKESDVKSFEYMRREDEQYRLGIVVAHNLQQTPKRGSCIFLHVQKSPHATTAGCTSMPYKNIKKIAHWLNKDKHPLLIQIPKNRVQEIIKLYPNLKNSKLLLHLSTRHKL